MIELEIYLKSEEDSKLAELGLDTDGEPEIKRITFLKIDYFYNYENDENIPKPATVIGVGETEYIANISYNELRQKLKQNA